MNEWKNKRDDWKNTRDNAPYKVEKGAVSGVSVGDAIAKVYESSKKGYAPLLKAATKLKTDLNTYMTKIKAKAKPGDKKTEKYAKFADWIKNNLLKDVDQLLADVAADLNMAATITKVKAKMANELIPPEQLNPSPVSAQIGKLRESRANATEDQLYQEVQKTLGWTKNAKAEAVAFAKYSQFFKSYKFKRLLPGLEARYKQLATNALNTESAAKLLLECCACKNYDELDRAYKPASIVLQELCLSLASGFDEVVAALRGNA